MVLLCRELRSKSAIPLHVAVEANQAFLPDFYEQDSSEQTLQSKGRERVHALATKDVNDEGAGNMEH